MDNEFQQQYVVSEILVLRFTKLFIHHTFAVLRVVSSSLAACDSYV